MTHRTRIEPEEIQIIEDDERRTAIAFRAHCACGYVSPVPLLTQVDAGRDAYWHREMYADEPRVREVEP